MDEQPRKEQEELQERIAEQQRMLDKQREEEAAERQKREEQYDQEMEKLKQQVVQTDFTEQVVKIIGTVAQVVVPLVAKLVFKAPIP
jgi:vacuolar-type H+-ATPase subunit I/STV1